MSVDYKRLSKTMSLALRHAPGDFGLTLQPGGWVTLDALLAALHRRPAFARVSRVDIELMMAAADKQRYELAGDRIRALYGHSVDADMAREAQEPPELLFHGTQQRFAPAIRRDGLKPMSRQHVHLSTDTQTATMVARRRGEEIVLLRIRARDAHAAGLKFYPGNDAVWLADLVPPRWIEFSWDASGATGGNQTQ